MRLVIAVCGVVLGVCLGLVVYVAVSEVPGTGERIGEEAGAAVVAAPRLPATQAEQTVPLQPLVPPSGEQSSSVDPVILGASAGPVTAPLSGLTDTERRALDLVSGGTRFSSDGTPVRPPLPPAEAVEEAGPEPYPPGGGTGGAGSTPPTEQPPGPTPSDPGPSDPGPSDPGPSDPAPSEPAPSDPVPSDPPPSDPPPPTDPVPTDPVPSDPPPPTDPVPSDPTDPLPSDPTDPLPSDPTGVLPDLPLP
jgi:hypothetical protein